MATINGPNCNQSYEVDDNVFGEKVECTVCNTKFVAREIKADEAVKLVPNQQKQGNNPVTNVATSTKPSIDKLHFSKRMIVLFSACCAVVLVLLVTGIILLSQSNMKKNLIKIELPDGGSLEMVKVEAGTFEMSANDGENGRDEVPHRATLTRDFYIGRTEVTQAQWKEVMGWYPVGSSNIWGDDLPASSLVSWNLAMEFCEKLNSTGKAPSGWKFTLPTETQWEYAARGGKKSKGYKYSGSNDVGEVAWCGKNSGHKTHPVGQKKANELGLYDMSGNVEEWCLDDWNDDSSKQKAEFSRGNDQGGSRMVRGGGYILNYDCRSAGRGSEVAWSDSDNIGFRLALVPENSNKSEAEKTSPKSNSISESDADFIIGLVFLKNNEDSSAVESFRKAAEQGHVKAQYMLGLHYCEGVGVKRDRVEGVKWLRKAAEQGDKDAREALREIGY